MIGNRIVPILLIAAIFLPAVASADDLYRVAVQSEADAVQLNQIGVQAIIAINGGYLVLADEAARAALQASDLKIKFEAESVERDQLAFDRLPGRVEDGRYPLVFAENGLVIRRVDIHAMKRAQDEFDLIPVRAERVVIRYRPPKLLNTDFASADLDLINLINRVRQDSIQSYMYRLQAFSSRLTGTASNYAARDWLVAKFEAFGYDSVVIDPFSGVQIPSYEFVQSYNVIATKVGARYPDRQIIIGAHFDDMPYCPGADDNASGVSAVLEVARILHDIPTDVTFIFIAFDSEESWMWGSYHYVEEAAMRGDNIVFMLNPDMIGHLSNSNRANLYTAQPAVYAELWARLADSLVGITAEIGGPTASDNLPFEDYGYDAMFEQEYYFSTHYHQNSDSTTYINFNYMTRMTKAALAQLKTIDEAPPGVLITSVRDVGDGQALQVNWQREYGAIIDHYIVKYNTVPPTTPQTVEVAGDLGSCIIEGLTLGQPYTFSVISVDERDHNAVYYNEMTGTPYLRPALPENLSGLPLYRAVRMTWKANNTELDFDHFGIIRDGVLLPHRLTQTTFIDDDFTLGSGYHQYMVVAVDQTGYISDTTGAATILLRAATLDPGHILAVNRSSKTKTCMINETVTGQFMREALDGLNYDYFSDTAYNSSTRGDTLHLDDMLDYELVIIGGESARGDDLGMDPIFGGMLDTLGNYLALGGKVIIFSRWGELRSVPERYADTAFFESGAPDYGYATLFDMRYRVQYLTEFNATQLLSDLVGAHSLVPEYPPLVWDSLATVNHSSPWTEASGIPCPVFASLYTGPEVIYTYDSRTDFSFTEGRPVAWRYLGSDYQYIFFAVPLSFMERTTAVTVLQTAVSQLASAGPAAATTIDPDTLDIPAGPPETIDLYLGDFAPGITASDVDVVALRVNGNIPASATAVLPSYPPFAGEVLQITVPADDFISSYGMVSDSINTVYAVSWKVVGDWKVHVAEGQVTILGQAYVPGDANGDWTVDVGDGVFIVNYVFKGGPAPAPIEMGDANCDGTINVGDAVHIINYVFKGGAAPGCL